MIDLHMKKYGTIPGPGTIITCMRTVCFTLLALICLTVVTQAGPRLEIPDHDFDFGLVPQNSTVSHSFWLKSVGDDTLRITDVKTGCSCALMPMAQDFIPPGDSMLVALHWKVGRRIGKVGRYPSIFTNQGPDPHSMKITASVALRPDSLRPLGFLPYKFELAKHQKKSIDEIDFQVVNRWETDLELTVVGGLPEEVVLDLPSKVEAGRTAWGTVRIRPEYADTEFATSITIEVNDVDKNHITVPIRRKLY